MAFIWQDVKILTAGCTHKENGVIKYVFIKFLPNKIWYYVMGTNILLQKRSKLQQCSK